MPAFAPSDVTFMSPVSRAATVAAIFAVIVPPGNDTAIVESPGGVTWVGPWSLVQAARPKTSASAQSRFTVRELNVELERGDGSRSNNQNRPPMTDHLGPGSAIAVAVSRPSRLSARVLAPPSGSHHRRTSPAPDRRRETAPDPAPPRESRPRPPAFRT